MGIALFNLVVLPPAVSFKTFARVGFSLSSVGDSELTFYCEEFGVLSSLDSVVWIPSLLNIHLLLSRYKIRLYIPL